MTVRWRLRRSAPGSEETICGGFACPIRVERVDWVALAAWAVLFAVYQPCADVDEVAPVNFTGGFKERDRGRNIQADEIEPAYPRRTNSTGCAVNDSVGLKIQD